MGTVRKYVAPAEAEAEGLVPGGPPLSRAEWLEGVERWFPELVDARLRSLTFAEVNGHRDRISEWLDAGVTVSTIHQRLRDDHGVEAGLASVRRYVWLEFADREPDPERVTVLRPEVESGSEAQIDYGYLGRWRDPVEDRLRKVWAFVMVLAYSRHMFVRPVLRMDETAWVAAHVAAFEFFAGVPGRLVPDNLATGVTKADLYDPKVNRAYAEMAAHYDCLIDPARARKPKDRGSGGAADALHPGQLLAGRGVRLARGGPGLGGGVVVAGGRAAPSPQPGGCGTAQRVPRRRSAGAGLVAGRAVRAGRVVAPEGGFGLPRQGRRRVVLGAVAPHRRPGRCPHDRQDGGGLRRLRRGQDAPPDRTGPGHRLGRLPAGEGGVLPTHPDLVPQASRRTRSRRRRVRRGPHGDQRAAPAPLRARDHRPGRQARPGPCRRGVPAGHRRRRPTYRTVKGILAAGTENTEPPEPAANTGPAHLHGPDALFGVDGDHNGGEVAP